MAYKDNTVSLGGYVERRNPIRMNVDAFAQAINKIDERREKAIQYRNSIKSAIANVKLDKSEDGWKYDFAKKLDDRITAASMFGDLSQAYEVALQTAGDAASSVELLGRQRAYEKREKELSDIKARNDLDALTKLRWEDENKYYYNDEYDNEGNVIGGSEWKTSFDPVSDINIAQYQALAAQMTAERSGGSSSTTTNQTLVDSNGNETKDFNQAADIKMTTTSGGGKTWNAKYEQEMIDTWNTLTTQDPNLVVALKQKYDTFIWAVNNAKSKMDDVTLSNQEREKARADAEYYESKLKDDNGFVYDNPDDWSKQVIIPQFRRMAYNNVTTNSVNSTQYNENFFAAKRQNAANAAFANMMGITEDVGVLGSPIMLKLVEQFSPGNIEDYKSLFKSLKKDNNGDKPFYEWN